MRRAPAIRPWTLQLECLEASRDFVQRTALTPDGVANVKLYASQQLDVSISGVGSVTCYGNPPTVHKTISGLGNLELARTP